MAGDFTATAVSEEAMELSAFPPDNPLVLDPEQVQQYLRNYDHLGGDNELECAMAMCTRALQSPFILCDPMSIARWRILEGTALYLRFERNGHQDDIDGAQGAFEDILATEHLERGLHGQAQYGLGRVFEALHDHCGLPELNKSVGHYQKARELAFEAVHFPSHLHDEIAVHVGQHLQTVVIHTDVYDSLSDPVAHLSDVVQRTADDEPIKAYALFQLAWAFFGRWLTGTRDTEEDLVHSEESVRRALIAAPGHRYRYRFLDLLGRLCITQARLQDGISLAKQAVTLLRANPQLHQSDDIVLDTLLAGYANVFAFQGRLPMEDVNAASSILSILITRGNTPPTLCSILLFIAMRFKATGRLSDIDDAIIASKLALQSSHWTTLPHAFLAYCHLVRFTASGEEEDFEATRQHAEDGLSLAGDISILMPVFLGVLSRLYYLRFDQSLQVSDLDLAVANGQRAVDLLRKMSDAAPDVLSSHGVCLLRRFVFKQDPEDLVRSILMQETALNLPVASHRSHGLHQLLWRYGSALRVRFEAYHDHDDSNRCAETLRHAIDLAVARKHPSQSLYLAELAALFSARYAHDVLPVDLDSSLHYYQKAVDIQVGTTIDRFRAAVTAAKLAYSHGRITQSTDFFSIAISLLHRIAWLGLNANKRHAKVVQTERQLACDAAASAIRAETPERAVEMLDEGRSVVWRSVLELRTDLRDLQEVAPELADELLKVANRLEHDDAWTNPVLENDEGERAAQRRTTAEHWEELVNRVRELDGFSSFLQPLNFSLLRQAARDGPTVLLNVSEYGSDALIVSLEDPVQVVPLPGLDLGTVRRLAYVFARAIQLQRDKLGGKMLEKILLDISRQLWEGGIREVAAALMHWQRRTTDRALRVWWIPTGFLSLLPIHCAGPYTIGHPGIADLFISSYSTTLSALILARQTLDMNREYAKPSPRMLAIGLSETPGYPFLPSTRAEMELLEGFPAFKDSYLMLSGADATVEAVTNALSKHNWVHACCHGHYDQKHPLNCAFNLVNGSLTLSQIIQLRLKDAEFAFLSACHTARHTAFVPDESINLAAALQVAGFKGVLGTAWSMVDRDGPQLTKRFYHWLTVNGAGPDVRRAAEAFHLAIKDLRGMGVPLSRWAAFVHLGI